MEFVRPCQDCSDRHVACAGCEAAYGVMYGYTITGRDVHRGQFNRVSQAQCWWKCASNRNCDAAVYNSRSSLCYLKNQDKRVAEPAPTARYLRVLYPKGPATPIKATTVSGQRPTRASRSSPSPSTSGSKSVFAADIDIPKQGANAYSENHFVHMPPFFKAGMLRLTCKDMGRGKDIFKCQELCFAMYKDECEYVQAAGDPGNCIVCKSGGSEDVGDVNVKGRDLNRVNCRNPAYVAAWKNYSGGENIGPHQCSQISDAKQVLYWVSPDGKKNHL